MGFAGQSFSSHLRQLIEQKECWCTTRSAAETSGKWGAWDLIYIYILINLFIKIHNIGFNIIYVCEYYIHLFLFLYVYTIYLYTQYFQLTATPQWWQKLVMEKHIFLLAASWWSTFKVIFSCRSCRRRAARSGDFKCRSRKLPSKNWYVTSNQQVHSE